MSKTLAVLALATFCGCAAPTAGDDNGDTSSSDLSSSSSWSLPDDVRAIGATELINYDDVPANGKCASDITPGGKVLGDFLKEQFEGISEVGGLACRKNTANTKKMSVHSTGRALDIMIPTISGGPDIEHGDKIANWLVANATEIGIQLVIWNHSIWQSNGKNEHHYGGPIPHIDHVHAELTIPASNEETAWFSANDKTGTTPSDSTTTTTTPDQENADNTTTPTPPPDDFVPLPIVPLPIVPLPIPPITTPITTTPPPATTTTTPPVTTPKPVKVSAPDPSTLGDSPGDTEATKPTSDKPAKKTSTKKASASDDGAGCNAGRSSSTDLGGLGGVLFALALVRRRRAR